jgi:hypothetical protein
MRLNRKPRLPKDLVKSPLSTSIPQKYVRQLERLAAAAKTNLAAYVRDVLVEHVDSKP